MITTSTPCIGEDGTIYIGSFTEKLHAINPDGTRKWVIHVGDEVASSPSIGDDGTIYVGVMGPGSNKGSMVAVKPNGSIKWIYEVGYFVTADPTIHPDGTIIFGSMDEYIYALYPNGTLRWRYKTGHVIRGHACIDSYGIIWIACWDGFLYAFDVDGTLIHKYDMPIDGGETIAIGPDGTIYVTYDALAAINPDDGSTKWKFNYLEDYEKGYLPSPAISSDGIIYIGTSYGPSRISGGQIYAINPDGTLRWRKKITTVYTDSSVAIAEDGTIYIGSASISEVPNQGSFGYLHAFNEVTSNEPPHNPEYAGHTIKNIFSFEYYRFQGHDPDNNPIQFKINWGTGRTSGWSKECASGEIYQVYEMIFGVGRRTIRFKTRDVMGAESDWVTVELMFPYHYNNPGWGFPLFTKIINFLINYSNI
jgi:outer membrane protein assembly factor BamB